MDLPENVAQALAPLFGKLPLSRAMTQLVVRESADASLPEIVRRVIEHPAIDDSLAAGLWLYVDDLDRSHAISQKLKTPTGSFWHGIMHRREGDFGNSHYWFRNTGAHPAMQQIADYDPHTFIDAVAASKAPSQELVELQQREWTALFSWCAQNNS